MIPLDDTLAKRSALVLMGAQALGGANPAIVISLGGLVGLSLAQDKSLVLLCHEVLGRSRVGDSISWRSEGWITGMAQKRGKRALQLMWT